MIQSDFTVKVPEKYSKWLFWNVHFFILAQYFSNTTDIYLTKPIIEDKVIEHHPQSFVTKLQTENFIFFSKILFFFQKFYFFPKVHFLHKTSISLSKNSILFFKTFFQNFRNFYLREINRFNTVLNRVCRSTSRRSSRCTSGIVALRSNQRKV